MKSTYFGQFLLRIRRVDRHEVLRGILARDDEDRVRTAGMVLEILRPVVDLTIDDKLETNASALPALQL